MAVDTVGEGAATPVRVIDAWDSDPPVRAASLTDAVALWVDLLDRGLWW